ncbi:MAG: Uma2 family endonuclease [Leptolyngbyaceae cyanobacterium SM1_1_3]|nr:Uma2 family endonuclease [Leptolyngbyaceae cyanobacterium SM1_1_3]NJO09210.1 Uma2 family endonuclease [Leptolyngbyaceae cyanobacterium SL_1_1]
MTAYTINLSPAIALSDEQFYQLCLNNPDLKFERNAQGDLIIMPPTGGETGNRNAGLTAQLWIWNETYRLGIAFDSSTGFKLPNGANRSPDAAWMSRDRWDALTPEAQQRFVPLCPDFVVELLSPSDELSNTQAKMQEYIENGAKLGWLLNRKLRQVEIYRPNRAIEILPNPEFLSGEAVLPGFELVMAMIW